MHHIHANPNNALVRRKQTVKRTCQCIQDTAYQKRSCICHHHAYTHALSHSAHFPCTKILTDKGCDRDSKGIDNHPVNCIDLCKGSPGSHRIGTKFVDKYLNDQVCNRVHSCFQCCRNADSKNCPEGYSVKTDFPKSQLEQIISLHQNPCHHSCTDTLTGHRCKCDTHYPHMKDYDKKNIQRDI